MSKLQNIEIAGDTSNTVNLPEHLIIDNILPRLPVKTLIRLKSVSKLWLSTISSPEFVRSHLDYSSSSSSGQFILLKFRNKDNVEPFKLVSLAYDEMNNLKTPVDLVFPLCYEPNIRRVTIVGSSNGLVCFNTNWLLYVYNPATRENRKIINPGGWQCLLREWFGYVPCLDDYCIVVLLSGDDGKRMYVYFMKMGKWQIINGYTGSRWDYFYHLTTTFGDVLYMCLLDTSNVERPKRIIGIDLVNMKSKEFPWLDWLNDYDGADFFVQNGCLSLLCRSKYYSSISHRIRDVWTLKTQGDWRSWEKSFSIHLEDWDYIHTITPTGKLFLECHGKQFKIIVLNNKDTQPLSLSSSLSQGDVYFSVQLILTAIGTDYVASLVSPFGTIESNEEEHHHEV